MARTLAARGHHHSLDVDARCVDVLGRDLAHFDQLFYFGDADP